MSIKKRAIPKDYFLAYDSYVVIFLLFTALSVAGLTTIMILNHQAGLLGGGLGLSGAASSTSLGEINLTLLSATSFTNQRTTIDFGSGYVNASCSYCGMSSSSDNISYFTNGSNLSSVGYSNTCCVSFNTTQNLGFLLENTGNVNLSVGYTCSANCTHAGFIGGSSSLAPGMGGLELKVTQNSGALQGGEAGSTDTDGSCKGGGSGAGLSHSIGWNITNSSSYINQTSYGRFGNNTYAVLSPAGHWLCGNATLFFLDSADAYDAAVIDINVTIPSTAPLTNIRNSVQLTFNGTSSYSS